MTTTLCPDDLERSVVLFPDCKPVEGPVSSAIYDLTRGRISTFPSAYFPFFARFEDESLGTIVGSLEDDDREGFAAFLGFLRDNEYVTLVDDRAQFPEIASTWDEPGIVRDAILDVDTQHHAYPEIIAELDALGCMHLQLRAYSPVFGLDDLVALAGLCHGTSIQVLEAVLQHSPHLTDEDYAAVVTQHRVISSLVLHSAPEDRRIEVDYGVSGPSAALVTTLVELRRAELTSHVDCGTITRRQLLRPSTTTFNELQAFNGCLHRKVAVDASGELRNCPAMPQSFGHHRLVGLGEVARSPDFQRAWRLKKDDIEVCRDCQFRYACTDCRAHLEDPDDAHSKPLKCGYDPYTDTWSDWRDRPDAAATVQRYRDRVHLPVVVHERPRLALGVAAQP